MILSYRFVFCVLITVGLCFTAPVYIDTGTGRDYNVLLVLAGFSREQIRDELRLTFYRVITSSANSYLTLFIPIIAAFPFVTAFCSERNGGNLRLTVFRSGRARYCVGKFLSCAVSGGLVVMFGYIIYGVIIFPLFPLRLPVGQAAMAANVSATKAAGDILRNTAGMFLYGAASALPAFLLSTFIKNRYIIACEPFMLIYTIQSAVSTIVSNALSGNYYDSVQWVEELSPLSIQRVLFPNRYTWVSLAVNLLFAAASFLVFLEVMERKRDCGE